MRAKKLRTRMLGRRGKGRKKRLTNPGLHSERRDPSQGPSAVKVSLRE